MKENEEEECMMFLFHNRMADPHNDAILLLFIIPLLDCTINVFCVFAVRNFLKYLCRKHSLFKSLPT